MPDHALQPPSPDVSKDLPSSAESTPLSATPRPILSMRPALSSDFDLLISYRRECGWGESRLREQWGNENYPICIFEAIIPGDTETGYRAVGMGGWVLEEGEVASKERRLVKLSSLFISKKYQSLGFGSQAMTTLENTAVEKYNAKAVTLDTAAYPRHLSEDGSHWIQDIGVESNNSKWYKRRGYEQFGDIKPMFPDPATTDPEPVLYGVYFKKEMISRDKFQATYLVRI